MKDTIEDSRETNRTSLPEHEAKALLEERGLPVPEFAVVSSPSEAEAAAREIGFPVVMKIVSPDIQHKSDVDGVTLGIESAEQAVAVYMEIMSAVRDARPDATIEGVLVEEMIQGELEFIVGVTDDENFGFVVMAGLGGTIVELFEDVVMRLPPLDEETCWEMLESLKSYPLLAGYRGSEPVDVDSLVDLMLGIAGEDGLLVELEEELVELDLNPVIVGVDGEGCVVSDALVTLER